MADYKKSLYNIALGQQGYLLQGTPRSPARSMVQAPVFGNRFSMGDRDYNDFTFWWYWAQKDWSGGMKNKKSWEDDAKFYFSANIDAFDEYGTLKLAKAQKLHSISFIIDSYSESNQNQNVGMYNGANIKFGQTFTASASSKLSSCKFYLKKTGSPTGNATAILYAHTGTYGADGKPTGAALATSGNFDVSTLTTSYQLITFLFTGAEQYSLVSGTYYCIELNYSGGDVSNPVIIGNDSTTPTHSGNRFSYISSYLTSSDEDVCFYVYGTNNENIICGAEGRIDPPVRPTDGCFPTSENVHWVGGSTNWTDPANARACDETFATAADGTDYTWWKAFKVSTWAHLWRTDPESPYTSELGSDDIITGIEVIIKGKATGTAPSLYIQLAKDCVSGPEIGSKHIHPTTTNTEHTVGGRYDLWGTTWSPADFDTAGDFGVGIYPGAVGTGYTYSIDCIKVKVYFTKASTGKTYYIGTDEDASGKPVIYQWDSGAEEWVNITNAYMSTTRTLISQILFHRGILWFLTEGTDQSKLVTSWDGHTFTDHTADIRTDIERPGLFNSATCAAASDEESSEPAHFVIALLDEDKNVITTVDASYDADDQGDLPNSWTRWRTIEDLGEIRMADMVFFGDQWVIGLLSKPPDVWLGFLSSTSPFVAKLAFKDATIEEKGLGGKLLVHLPVLRDLIITIPENEIYRFDTVKGIRLLNREDTRKEIIEANTENDFWIKKGGVLAHDKIVWGHLVGEAVTVGSGWDSITQMNFQGGIREHLFPLFADDLHKVWAVDIATRKKLYKESDDYVATTADENFLIFSEFDTIATVDKLVYSVNIVFKPLEEDQKIVLWYSLDGGLTWESLGEVSEAVDGGEIITKTFLFPENTIVKKVMLKVGIEDTSGTSTPVFEDISMAYYPVPDYKQRWEIRVQCFDDLVLLDGKTQEAKRGEELRNILNGYWRNREIVEFQDVDFAETELSANITVDEDTIPVLSAASFPEKGIIRIGAEKIKYDGKSGVTFLNCVRGYGGTIAKGHTEADVCSNSYKTIITNYSERTPVGAETKINEFLVDLQLIEI